MMESMTEIMNKGRKCLTQHLGSIEAEQFISIIIREKFDYTKWQREYFDAKTPKRSAMKRPCSKNLIHLPARRFAYKTGKRSLIQLKSRP